MQFIIFHGSFSNSFANWEPYLKRELENLGHTVLTPEFPVDTWARITSLGENHLSEIQNLTNWTKTFEESVLPTLKTDESICFVGHSLAPVFILHMVSQYNLQIDSAIFVAPFLEHLDKSWQIDVVNKSFYKIDFDFEKLQKLIPLSYVLYSDNDPYVPIEKSEDFAKKTNSSKIIVKGAQHFNESAGYTEFPLILELCKSRFIRHQY